jgi:hypothetical protein
MVDAIYAFYTLIKRSRSTRINCSGLRGIGYTYINYYGPTENKIETMGHYKYSLVIENSHEYVSEKLIDAILAKTVPLYIGANLEKLNIPPNIAYTCEAQIDSVAEAMERLLSDSKLCKAILDNGQAFLKSRHFKKMKNNIALRNLAIDISEYIESV